MQAPPLRIADERPLELAELWQRLQSTDPAALLVPPWLLRRVIREDRLLSPLGLRVAHRRSYVIGRDTLLALATRDELAVEPERELPATVLLLARPDPDKLAVMPRGMVLVNIWRLLFHARVHLAVATRLAEYRLPRAAVRRRSHSIGQTDFDEIRTVLRQEKALLPPGDDRTAYEEFAAVYLELRFFDPTLLPRFFPTLDDLDRVDRILADDVDAAELFAATRLPGAPDPPALVESATDDGIAPASAETAPASAGDSEKRWGDLLARAEKAAAAGNSVRAALCRTSAAQTVPPDRAATAVALADMEVGRLVARLRQALHFDEPQATAWQRALTPLLPPGARGLWPPEARLLYDLQKICVDQERPIYAPEVMEWAYSAFRRPLVRPLPNQPLVLGVKHLRRAVARLSAIRVAETDRHALSKLLHEALHHAEIRLRERFRPLLRDVLHDVGLQPQNFPERIAGDKVVDELLDRIVERGFLNLGDVRDALAGNQLKLPDLSGPRELLTGDPLLRANRKLAVDAAGVYRRGEIYLRGLQRASALAFGTRPGRWFTLFFALPFGAAFGTIVFVQEMLHLARLPHHLHPGALGVAVGALGVFYVLLLHLASFRGLLVRVVHAGVVAIRTLVIDLPSALLRLPAVRRLLESALFRMLARYVLKPLPLAVLTWIVLGALDVPPTWAMADAAAVLLLASLLVNSRLGRNLEELLSDWAIRRWDYLRTILPGLFRLIIDLFKSILEAIDRLLYTVDEWLRFRAGQRRVTLVAKTILGFFWFLISYIVRLYVNVFIEPTVNPIKHFPAVTVAAKLLVPFWIPLTELFAAPLMFLGAPLAITIAFLTLHALPGAAGFLVWELKENWRLYRANRPTTLRPVVIGHHGETMLRLLRPGLHSGTLPKLYAKLRRAERRASRSGDWRRPGRFREALHHVEQAVRNFVERELLAPLNASAGWTAGPLHLAGLRTASNRLRLEIACPALDPGHVELKIEEQSGWLVVQVSRLGWLPRLSINQAAVLLVALTGFYKLVGIDLSREQIDAQLAPECLAYDIADRGLVVWPDPEYETEVVYDLREEPVVHPRVVDGRPPSPLRSLHADQLFFSRHEVAWQDWVEAWRRDQAGEQPASLMPGFRIVPSSVTAKY